MKRLRILSVNLSSEYNQLDGICQKTLNQIRLIQNWELAEADSLNSAAIILNEYDLILTWIDEKSPKEWNKLADSIQEVDIASICVFTSGENVEEMTLDALMRGMYAFTCPFNPYVIEAYIKAVDLDAEYSNERSNFEMKLFKANSLSEITRTTLKQLKKHPLVGYSRAFISLVDEETDRRYLIDYDSEFSDPDRSLMTDIRKDPLMLKLIEEGVLIIDDFHNEEHLNSIGWKRMGATSDIGSWAGIAVMAQDQVIAIITLDHIEKGHYSRCKDKLKDLLRELSEAFAEAILYYAQERNSRIVQEIIREIGDDLSIEELIKQILNKLREVLQCDNCTYFRVVSQPEEQELCLEEWFPAKDYPRRQSYTFKRGEGVVGAVLEDGKSRIIPHALESEEFVPSVGLTGTNLSMLAVPIIPYSLDEEAGSLNRVIGVISCYKKGQKDYFSVYDRDLVKDIAQNTASIIERTMILQYSNDISSKMNDLVLDKDKARLLRNICEHALKVTSARAAVIHRLKNVKSLADSEEQQEYIATGESYSFPEDISYHFPRLHGSGTTDMVISEKDTVEFSEELGNFHLLSEELRNAGVKHHIVVPLMVNKEDDSKYLIGALYLNKYSDEKFSKAEKFALKLFANQAANTIYHQEFLFERQVWTEVNTSLARAIEIITSNGDQDSLPVDVANYACLLTNAKFSEVAFFRSETQLDTKAVWPDSFLRRVSDFRKNYASDSGRIGITGLAARDCKSILIGNIQKEIESGSESGLQYLQFREETLSELAVPIIGTKSKEKKVIGVINLEHDEAYAFTTMHQTVIELFAKQVAIAIQKNQLFESIRNRNSILIGLQSALQEIIKSSPNNMLHTAVSLTREAMSAKDVIILLCSKEDKKRSILPSEAGTITGINRKFLIDYLSPLSSEVYSEQRSNYLENLNHDNHGNEREKLRELRISSGLCLPFTAQQNQMGTMWIFFSSAPLGGISEEEQTIYQIYANQIALAYANSQQSERLKQQVQRGEDELTDNVNRNYKDARWQAIIYFIVSLFTSLAGLILILYGAPKALNSTSQDAGQKGGAIAAIVGVILEGATVLVFDRGKAANERMDRYHKELFNLRKLSILLSATEQLEEESTLKLKQQIIEDATKNWIQSARQDQED